MAVFAYKATESSAAVVGGVIIADTPRQARDLLRARGLAVQQIKLHKSKQIISGWRGRFQPRKPAEVTPFLRELSTLLAVGIPLLDAIDTSARQHRGRFRAALLQLRDRIAAGISLAEAIREQPLVFSELCGDIAEMGEAAGTLDTALAQLAEFEERSAQFKNRIGTALLYPLLVLFMGVGVSLFLMTFVVPQLLSTLVMANHPLPLATRIVKNASDFLLNQWWILLLGILALIILMSCVLRTARGSWAWHRLQLRLPLVGDLIRKQAMVRIAVVMATLLRSGLVFVKSVEVAARTTRNQVLVKALKRFAAAIDSGQEIAPALESTGVFPPVVVQVFAVGQQSGRLEEMLERLASDYDRQVATAAARLTAVLEPLLIFALALLVGLVAFATILPILEAGNVF